MSKPPVATSAMLQAAEPPARSECAILPPSLTSAARVWKVLDLLGRVGELRLEPYSMPILVISLPLIRCLFQEGGKLVTDTYKA